MSTEQAKLLAEFFNGLASGDPATIRSQKLLAVDNSPAQSFVQHQLNMAEAVANETSSQNWTTSASVASGTVSWSGSHTNGPQSTESFTGFRFAVDGKLQTWLSNDQELSMVLSVRKTSVTGGDLAVSLASAFQGSASLQIAFTAENSGSDKQYVSVKTYRSRTGEKQKAIPITYSIAVNPRQPQPGAALVDSGQLGGRLNLELDYAYTRSLPVR